MTDRYDPQTDRPLQDFLRWFDEGLENLGQHLTGLIRTAFIPLLQNEFERVTERCSDLEAIKFGMGTYVFCFAEGSTMENRFYSQPPKYMARLVHLCDCTLTEDFMRFFVPADLVRGSGAKKEQTSFPGDNSNYLTHGEYDECEHGVPTSHACALCLEARCEKLADALECKDDDRRRLRRSLTELCEAVTAHGPKEEYLELLRRCTALSREDIQLSKWHDHPTHCKCGREAVAPCYSCWASLCEECLNEITGDGRTYCDSCLEGDN